VHQQQRQNKIDNLTSLLSNDPTTTCTSPKSSTTTNFQLVVTSLCGVCTSPNHATHEFSQGIGRYLKFLLEIPQKLV